jgi:addiction module HigA family antidote
MQPSHRKPTHPGEILLEEFLKPKKMTQLELAKKMKVPIQRINTLINEKRGVTPETAILLSRVFGTTPQFWMNLQAHYDLYMAEQYLSRRAA